MVINMIEIYNFFFKENSALFIFIAFIYIKIYTHIKSKRKIIKIQSRWKVQIIMHLEE